MIASILTLQQNATSDSIHEVLPHIYASRRLLLSTFQLPQSQLDNATRAFLIGTYVYIAVVSDISKTMVEAQMSILEEATLLFPLIEGNDSFRRTYGVDVELFRLIPKVSALINEQHVGLDGAIVSSWETTLGHKTLRSKISSWKSNAEDSNIIICEEIYQQALLLYLESSLSSNNYLSDVNHLLATIQDAFNSLTVLLGRLPLESTVSTVLFWPLAIFGSCASTPDQQDIVRQRLVSLQSGFGLRHIGRILCLLEELWARCDIPHRGPLVLSQIMKEISLRVYFL